MPLAAEMTGTAAERAPAEHARLLDWRVLLPLPAAGAFGHLVLLGGPPGLADAVLESGIARGLSCAPIPDGEADGLVVLHDARCDPRRAGRPERLFGAG